MGFDLSLLHLLILFIYISILSGVYTIGFGLF